jgi:hypothetical protein
MSTVIVYLHFLQASEDGQEGCDLLLGLIFIQDYGSIIPAESTEAAGAYSGNGAFKVSHSCDKW